MPNYTTAPVAHGDEVEIKHPNGPNSSYYVTAVENERVIHLSNGGVLYPRDFESGRAEVVNR